MLAPAVSRTLRSQLRARVGYVAHAARAGQDRPDFDRRIDRFHCSDVLR